MATLEINLREPQAGRSPPRTPVRLPTKSLGGGQKREKNTTVSSQQTLNAFNLFIPHTTTKVSTIIAWWYKQGSQQENCWSMAFKVNDRNQLFPL